MKDVNIPQKCDVLVVGGGPGGSLTAALLAQKGVDVVLLEKEQFPRETVGESLIPHFWKYLDLIGLSERVAAAGFVAKCGGATYWNQQFKKMSFADFGYKRPGMHVERATFDQLIADRAAELGAKVFFQTKVQKITHGEEWSTATYKNNLAQDSRSIQARFIVDASGQGALLGRQEKIRTYDEGFRFHAFWGYFKGGNYLDKQANVRPFGEHFEHRPLTFVSTIGDWGWVWQILLKEQTSVGLVLPKKRLEQFKNQGSNMTERFESMIRQTPLTATLMEDAKLIPDSVKSIKDYAYKPTKLAVGNSLLIGDAAAFVDPINSAGIVMALYGGYLAAWSIKRALDKPRSTKNILEMFSHQLKLRLDLFRLIAYPGDLISPNLIREGRRILSQLDDREKRLAMTQITLTNRAKNLNELLDLPVSAYCEEVPLTKILPSSAA